ncbi:DUF6030 family protein [Rhizobium sp. CSW-27]|uniref:DUF6030 family protein n=1 Tax=Rhizobium sp. CSW-27 TaxID=2839985 RepID=UPI001C0338D3|nr:DUF6030 family protein [Rhizobium sp. CSW-27]MBT9368980.1 hypothetical protein [Rhizobium sp. CSW-27]
MTTQSDQQAMGKLPRPKRRWALAVWLLLGTGATVGTVLFANDARNWKLLRHRLGLDIQQPAGEHIHKTERVTHRSRSPWFIRRPVPQIVANLKPAIDPALQCKMLAEEEQEPPQFTVDSDGNWQCLGFWSAASTTEAASVFLQVRGNGQSEISSWRMKLSKGKTDGQAVLDKGIAMMRDGIRPFPIPSDLLDTMRHDIARWNDFYMVLGPYVVTFRRELLDPTRFNLIALDRRVDHYPIAPSAQAVIAAGRQLRSVQGDAIASP